MTSRSIRTQRREAYERKHMGEAQFWSTEPATIDRAEEVIQWMIDAGQAVALKPTRADVEALARQIDAECLALHREASRDLREGE